MGLFYRAGDSGQCRDAGKLLKLDSGKEQGLGS